MIKKVHNSVLGKHRVKVRQVADVVDISNDSVHKIWTEDWTPKKAKTVLSAVKHMAIVFWVSYRVILVDYLEKA